MELDGYIGEIQLFGGSQSAIPAGWLLCDGRSLDQNSDDYAALFAIIGTVYGTISASTFNIPDLRGRTPIGVGNNPRLTKQIILGQSGGKEKIQLQTSNLPSHNHSVNLVNNQGSTQNPSGNNFAQAAVNSTTINAYSQTADTLISNLTISQVGGNEPHENMQPFMALNFIICYSGIYPSSSGGLDDMIGMIKLFASSNVPGGYLPCNGASISSNQNQALYSILNNAYGGSSGTGSFSLPDLRASVPMCSNSFTSGNRGIKGGNSGIVLTLGQMPQHNHQVNVNNSNGTVSNPSNSAIIAGPVYSQNGIQSVNLFSFNTNLMPNNVMLDYNGSNQPHDNMQPYLGINYYICTSGLYPSRD